MFGDHHRDELSLGDLKRDWTSYDLSSLKSDLMAGLEVSLLTVPQAIAYSFVAGLPASCGLFAAIFSALMAALIGSSRYLIVGPVNAIAILVQAGTADILYSHYWEASPLEKELLALEIMTQIALVAGLFQLLVALFKLGRLTQFVSHSVVVGYLAGGAFAIIVNQLFIFFGIPGKEGVASLYEKLGYFYTHLKATQLPTLGVGLFSLSLLLFLKRVWPRLPAAAITLISTGGFVYFLNGYMPGAIALVGESMDGLSMIPLFDLPFFDPGIMNHLLSVAFAVALLGIIEVTCTAKALASISGQGISINQEILAVGAANLTSSFTYSIPVSVSNSRSLLNFNSGAKTRFAGITNCFLVATMVLYFGPLLNQIPLVSLAALLFVTAAGLINVKQLALCLKSTRSDAFVLLGTFLACMFFNLDTAFYIGVGLSILLYLKSAALPKLVEYVIDESGELKSLDLHGAYLQKTLRVIKVEGELFFGSADIFYTTLKSLADHDKTTKVILLQLKNARDIDATTCLALSQLHEYLLLGGRHLVMCGMTQEVWDVMSHSGLIASIGKENLYMFDETHPHQHMHQAIARAKELLDLAPQPDSLPVPVSVPVPE